MLLEQNERFVKEFNEFNEKISKITNERLKSELVDLLNQLLFEVRKIDRQHHDAMLGIKLPTAVKENRDVITNLRKQIHRRLSESINRTSGQ